MIAHACTYILAQLRDVIGQINPEDFPKPSPALSNSTVGQHFRHTLEFFCCLEAGVKTGVVNYDTRSHDKFIESDKFIALNALMRVAEFVESLQEDKPLTLEAAYQRQGGDVQRVETNLYRELIYNIEHAVHHMALMKIGIREVAPYIQLPADFGIAASTIRHRESASTSSH